MSEPTTASPKGSSSTGTPGSSTAHIPPLLPAFLITGLLLGAIVFILLWRHIIDRRTPRADADADADANDDDDSDLAWLPGARAAPPARPADVGPVRHRPERPATWGRDHGACAPQRPAPPAPHWTRPR